MASGNPILTTFETRLRQLILQYREAQRESRGLREELARKADEIRRLHDDMAQLQRDYDNLKLARMLEVSDGDIEKARSRVAKLIRDVNKCITYLNENS
ncbi:MAG: hypothetical protein LUI08_00905 [Prevotella sp.]|nr:hypothetical protein [Prevotella sp.]MCD8288682.1 hypothetical protein [Prevotella sp.]MCD8305441.1 hypothetical protein [Prevotella sp.]